MKAGFLAAALLAVALIAGFGEASTSDTEPTVGPAADAAGPASPGTEKALASAAPLLDARSFPPRDDCAALPGWRDFRAKLQAAVARRDADALAALSDPDILLDFGGGAGVKELRQRLDDPDYRLWDEIADLLPLGCGQQEDSVAMPWIFANSPPNADAYGDMLVLGPAVPAYAGPDAGSSVKAMLNWPIVTVDVYEGKDKAFTEVILPDNAGKAFVETRKLRSLIEYRLIARNTKQGWRITALIAGD
jgi:hypothetical protein